MKKLYIFFLLFLCSAVLIAQKDKEHWIAPYFDSSGTSYAHALYFSTDAATPTTIQIYAGTSTVPLGSVTISKGNPQSFPLDDIFIRTTNDAQVLVPTEMGIHTVGTQPYFLTMRVYSSAHGEILTSKGAAGLGKEFRAVMAPLTSSSSIMNFTAGVMATEDNTTVTISEYDPNVEFINGTGTTPPQLSVTLNKGQSYLVAGDGQVAANADGFIGAKITANKPIAVTNGNANGMFATGNTTSGSDLILDQSVPVDKLGKTFGMVRSITYTGDQDNMEGGIIVATEDGTQIFTNTGTTALATINAGEYYRILSDQYIQAGSANHYNMSVRTNKNVYLYQLLGAGSGSSGTNTGGFNYIPPLSCYLPRSIDEIGQIQAMPSPNPLTTLNLKLNIITENGAVVTLNNAPLPATAGPYPLPGDPAWVTYSIQNITGNVTINSTKAVTAGINGGYSTAGYGGYFAGFSSVPLISKVTGDCIPNIILQVETGFDTYQWQLNGNNIAGATQNTYQPQQPGIYTCVVKVGSCAPVTTPAYNVYRCLVQTSASYQTCGKLTITPKFSFNSTQTIPPANVSIITPPTSGTLTVNPTTGQLLYTPSTTMVTEYFVYKFCGNGTTFQDCEQVAVTIIRKNPPPVQNLTLRECPKDDNPNLAIFNLGLAVANSQPGTSYNFYTTSADADAGTNPIQNPNSYTSGPATVYLVANDSGCISRAMIKLEIIAHVYSPTLKDIEICAGARATLDAGPGYSSYLWSTGATTQVITNVTIGEYTVKLGHDKCYTTQTVKVTKLADPVISHVEINNNTATLTVTGGKAPYQYSTDGLHWQTANVLTDLPRGENTFYVKDASNCDPVIVTVTVPNFVNAITPNGDSNNDAIDYAELLYKDNFLFVVYDRYGKQIFDSKKGKSPHWDGTFQGKKLSTGTYWYVVTWTEGDAAKSQVEYHGWIFLKN